MCSIKRAKHAVYDLKYHFVWVPKPRKLILQGSVAERLKEIFQGIADRYGLEIDIMELMPDHVHLFLGAPPKYSPSEVVQISKSISARELFRRYPGLREKPWSYGYFVRSVGDEVTATVIRRYVKMPRSLLRGSLLNINFARKLIYERSTGLLKLF